MELTHRKIFYLAIALLSFITALWMFSIFEVFIGSFFIEDVLTKVHPASLLVIIGIMIFGGIFLFNMATRIMIETVK